VLQLIKLRRAGQRAIEHFWSRALKERFPDRTYRFETVVDLYDEHGPCLTFWQDRSERATP
jgi:hypothetical protein